MDPNTQGHQKKYFDCTAVSVESDTLTTDGNYVIMSTLSTLYRKGQWLDSPVTA